MNKIDRTSPRSPAPFGALQCRPTMPARWPRLRNLRPMPRSSTSRMRWRRSARPRRVTALVQPPRRQTGRIARSSSASMRSDRTIGQQRSGGGRLRQSLTQSCCPRSKARPISRSSADWLADNDAPEALRLWAMIETPRGVDQCACNRRDRPHLRRQARLFRRRPQRPAQGNRCSRPSRPSVPHPLADADPAWPHAASGLDVIDAVFNDFRDADGFDEECRQGRDMGYDGKMLIHPAADRPGQRALRRRAGRPSTRRAPSSPPSRCPRTSDKGVINLQRPDGRAAAPRPGPHARRQGGPHRKTKGKILKLLPLPHRP